MSVFQEGESTVRRSLRLLLNGYYTSNGVQTVSHKETTMRPRRRRRNRRPEGWRTMEDPVEDRLDNSSEETQRNYRLIPFYCLIIFVSLFYGYNCLFPGLYSETSPTTMDTFIAPECKEVEKLSNDLYEEVLLLKEKMDYNLPSADLWPNFALESLGATIEHQMTSDTYQAYRWFGFSMQPQGHGPRIVIQGKYRLFPGQCWAFAGSQGRLTISLPYKLFISQVSLGHIPKFLTPPGTISSAPKEFSIYGRKTLQDEGSVLGTFQYDEDGDILQTFNLHDHETDSFGYITLEVKSNWGHSEYTCLYGFRVHGTLAE